MAHIKLAGNPATTNGEIPQNGETIKDFKLITTDLKEKTLADFKGSKLVFNIFPSVGTGTCSSAMRKFNKIASEKKDVKVLCISRDLPFAQKDFCAAEGLEDVVMLSDYATHAFGKDYGLEFTDSIFQHLLSRVVIVADADGKVIYSEQVPDTANEINYDKALKYI